MPKTLHLPLTFHWWDEIAEGRKTCEYRQFTEYWRPRIGCLKKGDKIIFRRGRFGQTLTRTVENVRLVVGWNLPNEVYNYFGKPNEEKFFEIQFSKE